MNNCAALSAGFGAMLAVGCASPEPVNGRGETITLERELEPEVQEGGFAVLQRQPGWMRYIVVEPDGNVVEPPPGAAEVDHFQPEALHELNRAVTDQNQDTQTPRPLLRR